MRFYGQAKGRKWHTEQPEPTPVSKGLKQCTKCKEWKPITEFYECTNFEGHLRHKTACKACYRENSRKNKAKKNANK